ncbi:trypsin-like peptidase domain-containing protein [Luteolibacter marinus]|uniref:trypsin-like peptidase domain-containing protein n=1 Tax=Luteolibacter marinus TaxID=2776705 RepID=UPI001869466B
MKNLLLATAAFLTLALPAARAAAYAEAMMHATFKLFNKDSTATCFLLRDQDQVFLVTAAHTLEKASGETSIIVLREPGENGTTVRKDVTIPIREGERALWTKHPARDLAVLAVNLKLAADATLPLAAVQAGAMPGLGDPVMVLTYPARVEANGAGFPIARHGVVASFPAAPVADDPVFVLDINSWDGDSGGPVFRDDGTGKPRIVGLVIERINHVETIKSERESRKIETPMGLSKALHAPLILETIEKARAAER